MRNAIALALVLFAAPAFAADKQAAIDAFDAAVAQGDSAKLLSLWPKAGSVKLFGKKVARGAAEKAVAQKNGLYKLLRWHGPEEETGAGPVPPAGPQEQDGKVTISTSGYGKQPECTLAPSPAGDWSLLSCKLVDNGAP